MKILVTGSTGFIGTNLINRLQKDFDDILIYSYNSKSSLTELDEYIKDCDFVFHLAAVHRSSDLCEFRKVNVDLFSYLINGLENCGNRCPIVFTSSRQAEDSTAYGLSKHESERLILEYAKRSSSLARIYRLTNTFGRYARPNVHSVVATFCYNLQRNIPIIINDSNTMLYFYYIDDVIDEFIDQLNAYRCTGKFLDDQKICYLSNNKVYTVTLGELSNKLKVFQQCRIDGKTPPIQTEFDRLLLFTYDCYKKL